MRLPILMCLCAATLGMSGESAAGIRQCVDAQGKTYFSDKSCNAKPVQQELKKGVAPVSDAEARVEGGSLTVLKFERAGQRSSAPRGKGAKLPAGRGAANPRKDANCGQVVSNGYRKPCGP